MKLYYTKWTKWYFDRFFELCETAPTYKSAWEALEEEHFAKFHFYRCEDYSTFRVVKSNYLNQGKPKVAKNQMSLFPEFK